MLLNCGVGEVSWESLGLQGDPTSPFWRQSVLGVLWKDWCWSWNSNILATWCEELTHLKRPWCWERLKAGGEGDDRGWDGWMASPTQWTWVWINSGSWWWTGRPGVLWFMGSGRVEQTDWATELNWLTILTASYRWPASSLSYSSLSCQCPHYYSFWVSILIISNLCQIRNDFEWFLMISLMSWPWFEHLEASCTDPNLLSDLSLCCRLPRRGTGASVRAVEVVCVTFREDRNLYFLWVQ